MNKRGLKPRKKKGLCKMSLSHLFPNKNTNKFLKRSRNVRNKDHLKTSHFLLSKT